MTYQSMENTNDGMPLLREKGTVQVVDEGGIDELNGTSMSRRSRRGAALGLIVLALGAVSALSSLGGKPSSQSESLVLVCVCRRDAAFCFLQNSVITLFSSRLCLP